VSVTWTRVRAVLAATVAASTAAGGLVNLVSAAASPLPDLASVEQVIGAPRLGRPAPPDKASTSPSSTPV